MTRLLTVKEVSAALNCGHTYVYTLIARGELKAIKLDRLTRIPVAAVEELIAEKIAQNPAKDES